MNKATHPLPRSLSSAFRPLASAFRLPRFLERHLVAQTALILATLLALNPASSAVDLAIEGEIVYTLNGPPITNGIVLVESNRIAAVGPLASTTIPAGTRTLRAQVVTPGLIDAHSVVGLSGLLNQPHDQDQLEKSAAIQPELRAVDAYNGRDPLVAYVRSFGVTTLHTGHAPGAAVSGQTLIVKTHPASVEQAALVPEAMITATIGLSALGADKSSAPGTVPKLMALLRSELLKARDHQRKRESAEPDKKPDRDLRLETLGAVLRRERPLLVTAHRHQDILAALRLAREFEIRLVLDGAADAPLVLDEIRSSGVPVIVHPTMARADSERENLSMETAATLQRAGVRIALQSGYESYVPKTRVVLLEAAVAVAHGLPFEAALAALTLDAARLLGIDARVGSLEPGKDADLALYDGDPFEYTTHCVGVVVSGTVTDTQPR